MSERYFLALRAFARELTPAAPSLLQPAVSNERELASVESGRLTPAQVGQQFRYPDFVQHLAELLDRQRRRERILDKNTLSIQVSKSLK